LAKEKGTGREREERASVRACAFFFRESGGARKREREREGRRDGGTKGRRDGETERERESE
jgi:hypothetical protein